MQRRSVSCEAADCYYRIYKLNMPRFKFAKKEQIGSTIGTTFVVREPDPKMKYYAIVPVNMHSDTSE